MEEVDYEMFTTYGNRQVHRLVLLAKKQEQTWAWLNGELMKLATVKGLGEANDTAVRECAYSALGRKYEDFYS